LKELITPEQTAEQPQQDMQAELEEIVELKGQIAWDDDLEQMRQDRTATKPPMKGLP